MICPNCDKELNENGECLFCGYGMEEADGELSMLPENAKQCAGCGIMCEEKALACPVCGRPFAQPQNRKTPNPAASPWTKIPPKMDDGMVLLARVSSFWVVVGNLLWFISAVGSLFGLV